MSSRPSPCHFEPQREISCSLDLVIRNPVKGWWQTHTQTKRQRSWRAPRAGILRKLRMTITGLALVINRIPHDAMHRGADALRFARGFFAPLRMTVVWGMNV